MYFSAISIRLFTIFAAVSVEVMGFVFLRHTNFIIATVLMMLQIPAIRLKYGHSVSQVAISYIKSTPFLFSIRKMEKNVKLRKKGVNERKVIKMYTEKVAKYVADKGISIKKISERTGIPYNSLYNSLMNTRRKRELRADEFMAVCIFIGIDPMLFADKDAS